VTFFKQTAETTSVEASFPNSMIAQHGGLDPISYQYNYSMLAQRAGTLQQNLFGCRSVMPPNIVGTRTPRFINC
jgi:hypothetical protein